MLQGQGAGRELLDDGEVVGDEQTGAPEGVLEFGEEAQRGRLGGDVEGAGRLVADDEPRLAGDRPGDGDALAPAPAELPWTGRRNWAWSWCRWSTASPPSTRTRHRSRTATGDCCGRWRTPRRSAAIRTASSWPGAARAADSPRLSPSSDATAGVRGCWANC
ncbi:hypothetical protein SBD_0398 [Streptomyces bottropensis ATCC 25435]|uniref:Uncharacterized protein n=1 Tax=Streptomyces bottropensis ATCC 25435 TaxID=1054862 RepID=M3DLE0_9ACTN|nr:hypothetical protein SBD_0398 [Streptomyces bottropensis ATCC 25435]